MKNHIFKTRCFWIAVSIAALPIHSVSAQTDEPCPVTSIVMATGSCIYYSFNVPSISASFSSAPCTSINYGDVWFSVVVPTGITSLTFNVQGGMAPLMNGFILYVMSGSCPSGPFTNLGCTPQPPGNTFATQTINGLNPGDTLFVRVVNTGTLGNFQACVFNPLISGLVETGYESSISVYPNPAKEELTVNGFRFPAGKIEFYNVLGELVFSKDRVGNSKEEKFDLAGIPSGMYFVKVVTEKGTETLKVVRD